MIRILNLLNTKTKLRILLCALISILPSFFEMLIPQFIKQFIIMSDHNNVIEVVRIFHWQIYPPSFLSVYQFLIILVLASGLLNLILWFASQRLCEYTISHIRHLIRLKLFDKIIHLSKDDITNLSQAAIITYFGNDIGKINSGFFVLCRSLFNGLFLIIWGVFFSLNLDLHLSIAIFVNIPIVIIGSVVAIKFLFPLFRKENYILDKLANNAKEDINGIELIKAYNLEETRFKHYQKENNNLLNLNYKVSFRDSLAWPIIHACISIGNILVFIIFGFMAKNYTNDNIQSQVGNIYQFLAYLSLISSGIFQVCFESNKLFRASASSKRIYEVLNLESKIKDVISEIKPTNWSIAFENVSYIYPNNPDVDALKNITFDVKANSSLGIIGSTGSGKSTIVNLLTREILPDQGTVKIGGYDLNLIDTNYLKSNLSAVMQKNMLLSGSIKENITLTNENASEIEIYQAINISQSHFINEYENSYEQIIGQHGINLSGGQKQRISIAQGIIKKPKILILDDTTSALDNQTDKNVQKEILNNFKDITLIIISQRIRTIENLDKIIVLDKGKIVGSGTHQQLLKDNQYYQEIFESQKEK
ncbi:ABC transporter ATP-binding protein [Mycoplasmopsis gallinacea]|nr:ABC transporter ATP-binding protein [Mycoplasmopsis gallinacea]